MSSRFEPVGKFSERLALAPAAVGGAGPRVSRVSPKLPQKHLFLGLPFQYALVLLSEPLADGLSVPPPTAVGQGPWL